MVGEVILCAWTIFLAAACLITGGAERLPVAAGILLLGWAGVRSVDHG